MRMTLPGMLGAAPVRKITRGHEHGDHEDDVDRDSGLIWMACIGMEIMLDGWDARRSPLLPFEGLDDFLDRQAFGFSLRHSTEQVS
jgi:hypothetical protein